jgi:hypothetical protein
MPTIKTEIISGEMQQVGNYQLTPVSQVLKIMTPGKHVGFYWNRPKAVVVRTLDGQEQVLPVTDVTRIAIWLMLAGGVLGAILVRIIFWNR